jgi:hypothetical protein
LFIVEQIDALPEAIEDYLAAERNRQRHVAELQGPPRVSSLRDAFGRRSGRLAVAARDRSAGFGPRRVPDSGLGHRAARARRAMERRSDAAGTPPLPARQDAQAGQAGG